MTPVAQKSAPATMGRETRAGARERQEKPMPLPSHHRFRHRRAMAAGAMLALLWACQPGLKGWEDLEEDYDLKKAAGASEDAEGDDEGGEGDEGSGLKIPGKDGGPSASDIIGEDTQCEFFGTCGEGAEGAADGGVQTDADGGVIKPWTPDDQPVQECTPGKGTPAPDDILTGTFNAIAHLEVQGGIASLVPEKDRAVDLNLIVLIKQDGTIKDGDASLTGLLIEVSNPDLPSEFDGPAKVDPKTGEFTATIAKFLVPEGFNDQLCGDNTAAVTLNGFMRNHDCIDGTATVHFAGAKAKVLDCSPVELELKGDFAGQRDREAAK